MNSKNYGMVLSLMVYPMKKTKTLICDIDGVIMEGPWFDDIEDFYHNLSSWYPIEWAVKLVQMFHDVGYKIIFLTARDERVRVRTEQQLKEMFDFNIDLYMRNRGDERASCIVKEEHLIPLMDKYDIQLAIDDETPNIKMFQRYGITTIQVSSKWSEH